MRTLTHVFLLSALCAVASPLWADDVSVSAQVKETDKKESAEQIAATKPREVATEGTVTVSAIRGAAALAVSVPVASADEGALVLRPARRGGGSLAGRWRGWLTSVSISSVAVA